MNEKGTAAALRLEARAFVAILSERDTLVHSLRTALIIGTILALINHGADILSGQVSARWVVPMLVTYLVPFSVATYGQIHGKHQRDVLHQGEPGERTHEPSARS